ncbi:MAG TPA: nuclear transport factor 2 family protein [Thermomicrobiales bacterium]
MLFVTMCLALATGVALTAVGTTLTDAQLAPSAGSTAANEDLVGDFYDAVNETIRTGESAKLDALVSPDVVWCRDCPDQVQSRVGLDRYLLDLHRTAPGARLIVEELVADGHDTAMARVRVSGVPTVGQSVPWGPIDSFRLAHGQVVERGNGSDAVALQESLFRSRLDPLSPAVRGVAMARLTFSLGSGLDGLLSAGPTVVVVEAGSLEVRIGTGGRVVRAGSSAEESAGGEGDAALLHQGDAAIVPAGVRHSLDQQGTEAAVVLGVTLFYVDDGSDRRPRRGPELGVFAPLDLVNRDAPESRPLPGVRFLASGTVKSWPTGPVDVTLGRAVLGLGGRLAPAADEEVLAAVETGTLAVSGDEEQTVVAGTGVLRPAGMNREFRNDGEGLLSLLVLSVAPDADGDATQG